jgi:hypothetical protein
MDSAKMAGNKVVPITDGLQKTEPASGKGGIGIAIEVRVVREPRPAARLDQKRARRKTKVQHNGNRYTIGADDRVSLAAPAGCEPIDAMSFSSLEELRALTHQWPMRRLVSVWNQLPGTRRLMRFENRSIAVARLWRAIGQQRPASVATGPKPQQPVRQTKTQSIIAMLNRPEGATIEALMEATGWQAHSVRGFLSRKVSRELGLPVASVRREGKRVYCLAAPVCAQSGQVSKG